MSWSRDPSTASFQGRRKATRLLTRHGKCRHSKSGQKRTGKLRITHDISKRSEEAFGRSQIGDWEGDTVAGRQGGTCLIIQVDRLSGYLVGGKAARVNEATKKVFAGEVVLTVTLDRGKEFLDAEGLQEALGLPYTSAIPTISGSEESMRTPTAFSGTGFRRGGLAF